MKPLANLLRLACLVVPVLLFAGCGGILPSASLTVTNGSMYPLQAHYNSSKLDIFLDEVIDPAVEGLGPGETKTFDVFYDDFGEPELRVEGEGFQEEFRDFESGERVLVTQLGLLRNG